MGRGGAKPISAAVCVVLLAGCASSKTPPAFTASTTTPAASQLAVAPAAAAPAMTAAPATPFVSDPDSRTLQVAWNAARAEKCAFQVDQINLKARFLAWEGTLGTDPAKLQQLDRTYDQSRALVAQRIRPQPFDEYCSDATVGEIRRDVERYIAGDFSARPVGGARSVAAPAG